MNVRVTGCIQDPLLEVEGPISHWIRPETLVDLTIEGRNVNALVDSGSQMNTIMPTFVQQYGFMHIIDWGEVQEADAALAACHKWLCLRKDMLLPWWDTFLKECLGVQAEMEQGKMFFRICNSLVLNKGLMYVSTTPKDETEGVLAFAVG